MCVFYLFVCPSYHFIVTVINGSVGSPQYEHQQLSVQSGDLVNHDQDAIINATGEQDASLHYSGQEPEEVINVLLNTKLLITS